MAGVSEVDREGAERQDLSDAKQSPAVVREHDDESSGPPASSSRNHVGEISGLILGDGDGETNFLVSQKCLPLSLGGKSCHAEW